MRDTGLPPGWREAKLGELGSFYRGRGGTKADEDPNGMPCIRYGDLYTHHDCIVRSFASSISSASASSYTRLQHGDVVFAGSGETFEEIGKAAAYCGDAPAYAGADTIIFRPGPDLLPHFAGYAVNCENANAHKSRMGQGSSVIHIGSDQVAQMPFKLPPREQQRRIGEILSTVDEAIEQTEALIAKTQQIKAGLLHDLFTRGVTADGRLRPPCEDAPQLYKSSPLGWIPREWEPATINDLVSPARAVVYGILMPGRGHPGGIPVIKVKDIVDGEVRRDDLLLTSPQIDSEYQRSKVRPGDVLLTIRGTVGRLAQVPTDLDGANITQDTARIGIARGVPEFYRYYLETHVPRRHFAVNTLGQAVQGINLRDVRTTPVPIVPDGEQLKIADMVIAMIHSERTEREHLAKLTQARQGLMQDLLSGRVPATASAEPRLMELAVNV